MKVTMTCSQCGVDVEMDTRVDEYVLPNYLVCDTCFERILADVQAELEERQARLLRERKGEQ